MSSKMIGIVQRRKRTRAEPLAALLGLARGLPGPWHTSSSNIAMQPVVVRAAETEWRVYVHAFAVRNHLTDPRQVEVTVGLAISTGRLPSGRTGRARTAEWQRQLAKRLAALGYEGKWSLDPDGPHAHFHRELRRVSEVPAAIRRLQRVRF